MILTAKEIKAHVHSGDIFIDSYDENNVDPNSYTIHLGEEIIEYCDSNMQLINAGAAANNKKKIPKEGLILHPDRFYLGHTYERIGSYNCASELYANCSTALFGIFIQASAPLGHTGAVINWTLEIIVAQKAIVYPFMPIGRVCFWKNFGEKINYEGRYIDSKTVIPSRMNQGE